MPKVTHRDHGGFSILGITQQTTGGERGSGGSLKPAKQEGWTETIMIIQELIIHEFVGRTHNSRAQKSSQQRLQRNLRREWCRVSLQIYCRFPLIQVSHLQNVTGMKMSKYVRIYMHICTSSLGYTYVHMDD